MTQAITSWIGLAGVANDERPRALFWARLFEAPMLALAVWIIIEWYFTAQGSLPNSWAVATDRIIWLFFVVETATLTFLVKDKRRYLRTNWINLLVIVVGIPVFWEHTLAVGALRSLRFLLLFGFILEMSPTIRKTLAKNNLGLTLLVSGIIVAMAGISIAAIDPAIDTPWDGIWWAWVTVTTVGYGDLVPETPQGRIFGAILMGLGLGLFSLITATFSAFLIERDEEGMIEKGEEIAEKEDAIIEMEQRSTERETRVLQQLTALEDRLERLENNLDRLIDLLPDSNDDDNSGERRGD